LIAVDSSVVIAGFASWHELHERARGILERNARLPAHSALESYAVLTRLPPPQRVPPPLVLEFLADRFPQPLLSLSPKRYRTFLDGLGARGISGGATYDALIAAVASSAGSVLATCDRRALATYERCGAEVEFLG